MAKYRHRTFEMYEFRDEAIHALTPKSTHPTTPAADPESWTFQHFAVSRSGIVTHVQFKAAELGEETASGLREDFGQLAEELVRNSKVLLDFTGVTSFSPAAIEVLASFQQKLQTKGSRIVLCCLEPPARESFFADRTR